MVCSGHCLTTQHHHLHPFKPPLTKHCEHGQYSSISLLISFYAEHIGSCAICNNQCNKSTLTIKHSLRLPKEFEQFKGFKMNGIDECILWLIVRNATIVVLLINIVMSNI